MKYKKVERRSHDISGMSKSTHTHSYKVIFDGSWRGNWTRNWWSIQRRRRRGVVRVFVRRV